MTQLMAPSQGKNPSTEKDAALCLTIGGSTMSNPGNQENGNPIDREQPIQNVNVIHEEQMSRGDWWADALARVAGSWGFVLTFLGLLTLWILLNTLLLRTHAVDPFPFILLNLILSCLAAIQAPVILMSQNRSERKDHLQAEQDYAVNVKSEALVEELLKSVHGLEQDLQSLRQDLCHRMDVLVLKEGSPEISGTSKPPTPSSN